MTAENVVITGLGAVSCFGSGIEALWAGMREGRDGISPIARFDTRGFDVHLAALVPGFAGSTAELTVDYGIHAAREALEDAAVEFAEIPPSDVALVLGTSPGEGDIFVHRIGEKIGDALAVRGPRITVSTACTSSANALCVASELLRGGLAKLVIAGGTDVLTPLLFAGFHALGVLCHGKCAPFSYPFGTSLGEGAGFLVLETLASARARSARIRGTLLGYALSADAYHETSPDPTRSGVARAVRGALRNAGVDAETIQYVNAHGTGTASNDPAEWRALEHVLGGRPVPVSSTKSVLGHAQAAAGALEAIATLLAMEQQRLPQTLRSNGRRPHCPKDIVAEPVPRPAAYDFALSTNSAFGGANTALVLGTARVSSMSSSPKLRRAVWLTGVASLCAAGHGADALFAAIAAESVIPSERLERSQASELVAGMDVSRLDASSLWLTAATACALREVGIGRLRGPERDVSGLVAAVTRVSPESVKRLRQSIAARGLPFLSASAFSRMVLNAPAGTCSQLLALRGPSTTLSVGPGSGLVAALHAAELVEAGSAERMVAAAVDEPDETDALAPSEASAAILLEATPRHAGASPRLRGFGVAGPGELGKAVELALFRAELAAESVEVVFGDADVVGLEQRRRFDPASVLELGDASASLLALVLATVWLRRGLSKCALVVAARGNSATSAALLSMES